MITVDVFEKAILFAAKKHKGQRRKGNGRPYLMHPLSVMSHVQSVKKDSKNLYLLGAGAVLHDVVEDCGVSLKKIAKKFGYHVAALVEELTLDKTQYENIGKTEYLARHMFKMSSYALTIKLCDRLDNICDMDAMDEQFKIRYVIETRATLQRLKGRHLSKTHLALIELINNELNKYV